MSGLRRLSQHAMSGLDQDRSTARFVSTDPVPATFSTPGTTLPVSLRDVSVIGAQIEHVQPVRPALQGRLLIGELDAMATVVWTRLTGPGRYRSGLRIDAPLEVIAAAIREMLSRGVVRKGEDTLRLREEARIERERQRARLTGAAVKAYAGLPAADVRMVRAAREWLQTHADEATKWYNRARMTANEDHLRLAGSGRPNREDVLAIWEYLERRFDLRDIVAALE